LILDVATQLFGFPGTGFGQPWIVLVGDDAAAATATATGDSVEAAVSSPSSALEICENARNAEATEETRKDCLLI